MAGVRVGTQGKSNEHFIAEAKVKGKLLRIDILKEGRTYFGTVRYNGFFSFSRANHATSEKAFEALLGNDLRDSLPLLEGD